jgi:hypothetical protein
MIKFSDLFLAPPDPNDPYNLNNDNLVGRYTLLTRDMISHLHRNVRYKVAFGTAQYGLCMNVYSDSLAFDGYDLVSTFIKDFNQTVYVLAVRRGINRHYNDNGPFVVDVQHPICETGGTNPRYALQKVMLLCMIEWTHDCIQTMARKLNIPYCEHKSTYDNVHAWSHDCDLDCTYHAFDDHGETNFETRPVMKKHDSYDLICKMYALMRARLCVLLRRRLSPDIARMIVQLAYTW